MLLQAAMKNSSFYRLIRPMVSSSYNRMHFHGPLRHCRKVPFVKVVGEPFSLIIPWYITKSVCERPPSKLSTYTILEPGMILLRNYVSLKDQVDIVNMCQNWAGGFYNPRDRQSGEELKLMMMCFGRNWDPTTGYKERYRSDGSEPPPIPCELTSLAEATVQDAQTIINDLPSMRPDICLVNFYPHTGRRHPHQDLDESSDSLRRGLPVVSISIGDSAEFVYGHTRDENKLKSIFLHSGDVLIFGGKSRLIYYGVMQVAQYTTPRPLKDEAGLRSGLLSLTFRQF